MVALSSGLEASNLGSMSLVFSCFTPQDPVFLRDGKESFHSCDRIHLFAAQLLRYYDHLLIPV